MPSLPGTFRPKHLPSRADELRQLDERRGSASERGYNQAWAKAADGHRRRNPLCLGCLAVDRVTAAELVDHVEPHRGDTKKFWDKSMWQSSCRWHHDVVKRRLEHMWARGEIAVSELWLNSQTAIRLSRELAE